MDKQELLRRVLAAKASTISLRAVQEEDRKQALLSIRNSIKASQKHILNANEIDVKAAQKNKLSPATLDRLALSEKSLNILAQSLSEIAESEAVLGQIVEQHCRPDGLRIQRKRIALGVLAVIFESRPNVLVDCAALAIKSGNAIVLKGGSDAEQSNAVLGSLVQEAIDPYLPRASVQVISGGDRALTVEMVKLVGLIDLVIPRGGESLIHMIQEHARIPVIAHAKGLCHLYIHRDADQAMATAVVLNAKVQRPSVCNAIETLLVHESILKTYLLQLLQVLQEAGVQLRVDDRLWLTGLGIGWEKASTEDWDTEYLDKILSVRIVRDEDEAIQHIQQHSSFHTEGIIAKDPKILAKFETAIDASCIAVNASTRFNDGGELGLGAEIGISTTRLHAYGPMGARELTTTRFVVQGNGHCRA